MDISKTSWRAAAEQAAKEADAAGLDPTREKFIKRRVSEILSGLSEIELLKRRVRVLEDRLSSINRY